MKFIQPDEDYFYIAKLKVVLMQIYIVSNVTIIYLHNTQYYDKSFPSNKIRFIVTSNRQIPSVLV